MALLRLSNFFEIQFWTILIRLMEEDGLIMHLTQGIKRLVHTKAGLMVFLFLVLSTIGFLSGLILGRLYLIIQ